MSGNVYNSFKAAIIDMDGVITQTAHLHARAWKKMFDEFLKKKQGENFQPLNIKEDYERYIDGMLRFDGVRNFLRSRHINLPEGNPDDRPDQDTIYGLGIRKNEMFLTLLEKEGVHVYQDTLEMLKKWKKEGVKLAVISSSRNCRYIIKTAGLEKYFDVRVDGEISEKENLNSKPDPDIFLKASDLLETEVSQTIVIEDAISGVQAGKKGKFALVVGVARNGQEKALKEAGADVVVKDLTELEYKMKELERGVIAEELPNALKKIEKIFEIFGVKNPCLFLDYDGTLTPIVSNPDEAVLSDSARNIINDLSNIIVIGVISGRDRKDIESKIGITNLIYAGSHGFDIKGPDDLEMQYESGHKILPILDEVEKRLKESLKDIKGAQVERKKYAIAVHYRNAENKMVNFIEKAVFEELKQHKMLKKGSGKKIFELKPDLDWDKGRALTWLLEKLELNEDNYLPVFIGDDITDEDAFESIKGKGIGIIVGSHNQNTHASFRLENTDEVLQFFEELKSWLKNKGHEKG